MMENKLDLRADEMPSDYGPRGFAFDHQRIAFSDSVDQPTNSVDNFVKKCAESAMRAGAVRLCVKLMTKSAE
jgi:hypothetical protein